MSAQGRTVLTLSMLREALRVAEAADEFLRDNSEHHTDSVQVHLIDQWETDGVVRVELWSNENGEPTDAFTIDAGEAPGETGRAQQVTV